jgi:hypothetical protein
MWWRTKVVVSSQQKDEFAAHRSDMAECSHCHRLFNIRAGMSFILHLSDDHKMGSTLAISTVEHLYRKLIIRREHHRRQHEAAQANVPHTGQADSYGIAGRLPPDTNHQVGTAGHVEPAYQGSGGLAQSDSGSPATRNARSF